MGIKTVALGLMLVGTSAFAAEPDFFKNIQGCFNVTFRYIEDGQHDKTIDGLYEWVAVPANETGLSLQHVGVVEGHAFKHWREDWKSRSDGTWTQKVTGPFGDDRYECSAPFVFNQWKCSAVNAPKPRRDEARTDYETLIRENTMQVTSKGYVQVEINTKLDHNGNPVSNEVGWNEYVRVEESNCQAGKDYLLNHP